MMPPRDTSLAADRDRRLQVFLTQARGRARNGQLLRQAVDRELRTRALRAPTGKEAMMDDALVDSLLQVSNVLNKLGLPYAITGSVASSLYGEPHSTIDADLILSATPADAAPIAHALGQRFYAPADMIADAARRHAMANLIDNRHALKIDLSFIGHDPYLREVISRRVCQPIGLDGPEFWFVTPEDVILMKLIWREHSRSTKQWNDALGVVQVLGNRLDWKYLIEKAETLNLADDLANIRDEGGV